MSEESRPYHKAANLFPLLDGAEYEGLKADIKANGLLEPIWILADGSIIDGRNRHRACLELGITPHFRTWSGDGSLVGFVVSLNLHRRHLTASQRGAVARKALPMWEEEARERQRGGRGGVLLPEKFPEASDTGDARDKAAAVFGVNGRYVSDAKMVDENDPELFEKVLSGEVTLTQAKRKVKERKREQKREDNRKIIESSPEPTKLNGVYSTIVIDPPWDWGDEGDGDQMGRARPVYQTMTISQLHALPVGDLADSNCHIYLWITNRSLPKGFSLLESWGFRYVTCITWVKPSFGMGNYFRGQTEHVLFGVKGSQELLRRNAPTVFMAPRGPDGHSSKPPSFYDFIETCSPGPYLDMFSRMIRDGWVTWGEGGIGGD